MKSGRLIMKLAKCKICKKEIPKDSEIMDWGTGLIHADCFPYSENLIDKKKKECKIQCFFYGQGPNFKGCDFCNYEKIKEERGLKEFDGTHHTIICGWNDRAREIIKEIRSNNATKEKILGEVISGAVSSAIQVKLSTDSEEVKIGYPAIVEGNKYDFFCIIADISFPTSNAVTMLANAEKLRDTIPNDDETDLSPFFHEL